MRRSGLLTDGDEDESGGLFGDGGERKRSPRERPVGRRKSDARDGGVLQGASSASASPIGVGTAFRGKPRPRCRAATGAMEGVNAARCRVSGAEVGSSWTTRRRRRRTRATTTTTTTAGLKRAGPSTPRPAYKQTWLDRQLLRVFNSRVAAELGDDPRTATGDYDDTMRRCVRLVSTARTSAEAQARGERVLRSLLPPGFAPAFRWFIALFPSWFAARHAAQVTPLILPWLVGPGRVVDAPPELSVDDEARPPANAAAAALRGLRRRRSKRESASSGSGGEGAGGSEEGSGADGVSGLAALVGGTEGETPGYRQGVLLERCRVLEEGGCASVCLNVCKLPTQQFFTEEIGLPVTLEPNYETFECQFVYGRTPPPPELDKAFNTPCFGQCPITAMGTGSRAEAGGARSGVRGGEEARKDPTAAEDAAFAVGGGGAEGAVGSPAIGERARWIAAAPASAADEVKRGEDEEDGGSFASNCSRLPVYLGEDGKKQTIRRNHHTERS